MRPGDETAEFDDCFCVKETDKAVLVTNRGLTGAPSAWVPKSQLSEDSEVYAYGTEGKLVVSLWFAEKERLFE